MNSEFITLKFLKESEDLEEVIKRSIYTIGVIGSFFDNSSQMPSKQQEELSSSVINTLGSISIIEAATILLKSASSVLMVQYNILQNKKEN